MIEKFKKLLGTDLDDYDNHSIYHSEILLVLEIRPEIRCKKDTGVRDLSRLIGPAAEPLVSES